VDEVVRERALGNSAALFKIKGSEFERYQIIPAGGDGSGDNFSYYRIAPMVGAAPAAK
jgi:hypothetical protein